MSPKGRDQGAFSLDPWVSHYRNTWKIHKSKDTRKEGGSRGNSMPRIENVVNNVLQAGAAPAQIFNPLQLTRKEPTQSTTAQQQLFNTKTNKDPAVQSGTSDSKTHPLERINTIQPNATQFFPFTSPPCPSYLPSLLLKT